MSEKNIVEKVVEGIKDHARNQHEITKARHKAVTVTPADAKEMFLTQHEYANLSPAEKQKIQMEEIEAGNVTGNQILSKRK